MTLFDCKKLQQLPEIQSALQLIERNAGCVAKSGQG